MDAYDIANQLVMERASRDEYYMALFALMGEYLRCNGGVTLDDVNEFRRMTNVDYHTFHNCMSAAIAFESGL